HLDRVGVADHRALGIPGGAGGVADDRHVVGPALVDLRLEQTRMLGPELPAELLHVLVRLEPLVLIRGQPAGIVVDHEAQGRQLLVQGEYLVDLLLVLGDDHADLGVIPHVGQLLGDGVLVDRDGHAAETLRGHLGPVQTRTVVADDRQPGAPGRRPGRPGRGRGPGPRRGIGARSRSARYRGPSRGWPAGSRARGRCAAAGEEASSGPPRYPPLVALLTSPRSALITYWFARTAAG